MSIQTSLLIIISVVAVAAAATFTSFDAKKLDANSANELAATAETFPAFNQNATASFPLSGAKTPEASFPLLDAESDATAAAFLPWLFLLRIKQRLARHLVRKRNHSAPSKRRLKPAILWTTALLMAGIFTMTALANPLGLIPWIERGKKVWAIISTAATLYTVGSALHVLVGSKPGDTGAKMKATPSIYDEHPNYQSPTVQHSGASDGVTSGGAPTELSDESAAGTMPVITTITTGLTTMKRPENALQGRTLLMSGERPGEFTASLGGYLNPVGIGFMRTSESAQRENPISTIDDPDIWARSGFWVHYASSTKYEYPDVPLQSRISNPAWSSSKIDGDLIPNTRSELPRWRGILTTTATSDPVLGIAEQKKPGRALPGGLFCDKRRWIFPF